MSDILVKVMSPLPARYFQRYFSESGAISYGRCTFTLDMKASDYDWLVVYDDLRVAKREPDKRLFENMACHPKHSLLVTSEPSSIKHYGNRFVKQFGCILTSQDSASLPHVDRIYSQPALIWHYGIGSEHEIMFDNMVESPPKNKCRDVGMVFSPKRQRHTLHHKRFTFMTELMRLLPEMDVYGRGVKPLDDKAEAMDLYRYHVAVENYIGLNHWTEKLSDAFLGLTLPFYAGCPNAADYFPEDSFIQIGIDSPEESVEIIRKAIRDREYEKRYSAIAEARRRVLYEYGFFSVVSKIIEARFDPSLKRTDGARIYSRHGLRKESPWVVFEDMAGKLRARLRGA